MCMRVCWCRVFAMISLCSSANSHDPIFPFSPLFPNLCSHASEVSILLLPLKHMTENTRQATNADTALHLETKNRRADTVVATATHNWKQTARFQCCHCTQYQTENRRPYTSAATAFPCDIRPKTDGQILMLPYTPVWYQTENRRPRTRAATAPQWYQTDTCAATAPQCDIRLILLLPLHPSVISYWYYCCHCTAVWYQTDTCAATAPQCDIRLILVLPLHPSVISDRYLCCHCTSVWYQILVLPLHLSVISDWYLCYHCTSVWYQTDTIAATAPQCDIRLTIAATAPVWYHWYYCCHCTPVWYQTDTIAATAPQCDIILILLLPLHPNVISDWYYCCHCTAVWYQIDTCAATAPQCDIRQILVLPLHRSVISDWYYCCHCTAVWYQTDTCAATAPQCDIRLILLLPLHRSVISDWYLCCHSTAVWYQTENRSHILSGEQKYKDRHETKEVVKHQTTVVENNKKGL